MHEELGKCADYRVFHQHAQPKGPNSNENMNELARQYWPRGSDLSVYSLKTTQSKVPLSRVLGCCCSTIQRIPRLLIELGGSSSHLNLSGE